MSDKASKLLERMRRSKANWKRRDIVGLYKEFGFVEQYGGNHPKLYHPDFPVLVVPLPSTIKNTRAYVHQAVGMIDRLLSLQAAEEAEVNERK